MSEHLHAYLDAHPQGVSAADVSRDVLRLVGPDSLLSRTGATVLAAAEGVECGADGRWRRAGQPSPARRAIVAVVARATGRRPATDQLLELAASTPPGRAAEAMATLVRPVRPLAPEHLERFGLTVGQLARGAPLSDVRERVCALTQGRQVVVWHARSAAQEWLREWTGQGALALRPVLKAAGLCATSAPAAAAALGLPEPVDPDARTLARTLAAIAEALAAREVPLEPPAPPPAFDFDQVCFDAAALLALPERPGIYRFTDRGGEVLYVGKARNLRQRVASYFVHSDQRRARYAALVERMWDLEWEETGSELAALLVELREIRRLRPPINVQLAVRRRREAARGRRAILLPGVDPSAVDVLVTRDGHLLGHAAVDRRGRGMSRLRPALTALFGPPPPSTEAAEAEAQVLRSWLRGAEGRFTRVELSDAPGVLAAARAIKSAVRARDLFEEVTLERR